MAAADLTCRELVELVTEYLDGAMSPNDIARFEAHLAVCPGCAEYLAQMRLTVASLGHLPEESITPEARDRLLATFREWRDG